jgi:tetratricopeptide (TPR) repeat protein
MTTQRFAQLFTLLLLYSTSAMAGMSPELLALSESWAKIKYQLPEAQRIDALEALSEKAKTLANAHPGEAEPLVWQAIIISTTAGEKGGLGALSLVKEAKALLEQAEAIEPETLEGSVYTSLGSLYYQVPGWPLGFGDDDEAERYLKMALAVNPEGIDPNYIYGDFLMQEKAYEEAAAAFKRALVAPPREDRPIADAGRRTEIEAALAELKQAGYN